MSRENKFKAWIPDIERMYQVISIDVEPQNGRQKYVTVWEHPCLQSAIIKNKVGRFRLGDGVKIIQFTGLKDKNGTEAYEGDIIQINRPYRDSQTHYGENIPTGRCVEPLTPEIKTAICAIEFIDGCFVSGGENTSPLCWEHEGFTKEDIIDAFGSSEKEWNNDPEEDDLHYLLTEYPPNTIEELISYCAGFEIIGNIHANPELLVKP